HPGDRDLAGGAAARRRRRRVAAAAAERGAAGASAGAGRAVGLAGLLPGGTVPELTEVDLHAARPAHGGRERDVAVLRRAVELAGEVVRARPVADVAGHLDEREALDEEVDRHPRLDAPAGGQRHGRLEGLPGEAALPGERLGRDPARGPGDGAPRLADDDAAPARARLRR